MTKIDVSKRKNWHPRIWPRTEAAGLELKKPEDIEMDCWVTRRGNWGRSTALGENPSKLTKKRRLPRCLEVGIRGRKKGSLELAHTFEGRREKRLPSEVFVEVNGR